MPQFIKNAYEFIQDYPSILYSVALVIFLPLALFWSTFATIQLFESDLKFNIQSQSAVIQDALALAINRDFPKPEAMQATVDKIAADNDEKIANIQVITKEGRDFKVIVSQKHEDVGKTINVAASLNGDSLIVDSWAVGQSMAAFVWIDNARYWKFFKPLVDLDSQQTYALVSADIPLAQIDRLIGAAVTQAYAVMGAVILIVLFLVFQHMRLFSFVFLSKKLQLQNKAKDDFIRMATHELRSPVTVIIAYMETLRDELLPVANNDQKQYIERIAISIKNLNELMNDILEVSHLQQGRTDFQPEKIAAGAVIKEIVEGIRQKAEAKGLALNLEDDGLEHQINVNQVCFKRIIVNLVENAVKYTPAGKVTVSVKAETAKKRCVITVQDTGFGISAEGQRRLFEQFYRVKTTENSGIPGTGLGLWMSREMARKMGGDIMLESIERMGSRFFVFFPLAGK